MSIYCFCKQKEIIKTLKKKKKKDKEEQGDSAALLGSIIGEGLVVEEAWEDRDEKKGHLR